MYAYFIMSMPDLKAENIKRVVVRGTNWVGDAVMTVPALRELRRLLPNAHLTLATRPWAKGLFEAMNQMAKTTVYQILDRKAFAPSRNA